MTVIDLARLVADMRAKQRAYFRTRSTADLDASKAAEKRVDLAIKEALDQPRLFPEEPARA